jgi:hypothetical protein
VPLWLSRILLILGVVMLVIALVAFAWTEDTIYLTLAQGLVFGSAVIAMGHRLMKLEAAAGTPPLPEASPARNALWVAVFFVPAAALALLYDWRLYAFWTPIVLFVLLFLLFMGAHYATRLTRQLRATRSPSDGP